MNGERYYTTKIWERPSSIEFSSAGVLSTSMDPPGEPVISTWKRPCQKIQNGSEFPELVAQNFRNPQLLELFAGDDLTGALQKQRQDTERLLLNLEAYALPGKCQRSSESVFF